MPVCHEVTGDLAELIQKEQRNVAALGSCLLPRHRCSCHCNHPFKGHVKGRIRGYMAAIGQLMTMHLACKLGK